MENGNNRQYNSSITIRLDKETKDKITQEAQERNMSVSDYLRAFLSSAELPDALLFKIPDEHRQFIEKYVAREGSRTGRSGYDILSGLFTQFIILAMDKPFFLDFKRR